MTKTTLFHIFAITLCLMLSPMTRAADKEKAKPADEGWESLFDGKTLEGWKDSDFGGGGKPKVKDGLLILPAGATLSGVTYTGKVPKVNYEVALEAQKLDGSDFFVGLTFPVADSFASFIVGGWGGGVVGISSIDGGDASSNSTTKVMNFDDKKWYKFRVRVLADKIQCWIDDKQIIDADIKDKKIDIRIEVEESKPFGLASYQTTAAYKNIRLKKLTADDMADEKK
ncbi:MAG: DUF1080 domain-containing protein [Tepidisphaerales bacterium]